MSDESRETRDKAAEGYETAAAELERAAARLKTTARHFREGDVPRGCAHAWAAHGNVLAADRLLEEQAELHATKAQA